MRSLERQTLVPDEVVVVDNGSTDGTREWLVEAKLSFPLRVVEGPGYSYAEARNAGILAAAGETILFLDDDCEADAPMAERLRAAMERHGWLACGGVLLPADELEAPDGFTPQMNWAVGLHDEGIFGRLAGRAYLPTTACLMVRRQTALEFAFQEIGGQFSPGGEVYHYGREDAEWWRRLRRAGLAVGVEPRAIAWHRIPQERLDLAVMAGRARSDGSAHWRRERIAEETRAAARDIVRFPISVGRDVFFGDSSFREAWEANLLWARRQWEFLREAVDDPSSPCTPPHRLGCFLSEGGRAAASLVKASARHAAVPLVTNLRALRPLPTVESPPKSLLVVAHDLLGDTVLSLPMLRQLAEAFPDTRLTALGGRTSAPILRDGVGDRFTVLETSAEERRGRPWALRRLYKRLEDLEPDAVLITYIHDLSPAPFFFLNGAPVVAWREDNGIRQRFWADLVSHPVEKNFRKAEAAALLDLLEPFGIATRLERPRFSPGELAQERCARLLKECGVREGEYAVVQFEPAQRVKSWPARRMREVCRRLAEKGLRVFLDGPREGRQEWERLGGDEIPGCFPIHSLLDCAELGALLKGARLFVGVDSGPAHLAQAVDCPSVVLFGMTEKRRWGALPLLPGETNTPVTVALEGTPGDWLEEEIHGLPPNQGMRFLSVEAVHQAVESLLGQPEKGSGSVKSR